MLLMHITHRLRSDTVDMSWTEQNVSKQLQQCTSESDGKLSGWVAKTGRQGVYYLHEDSSLVVQNLGAARLAMQLFRQINQGDSASTEHVAEKDEERDELLSLCSCLDGVISHLQKQVEILKSYQRQPQESMEATGAVQSKIVDMYDVCAYVQVNKATLILTQEDTLLQRSTKLRCQLLLATCAVFAQKLLIRSSYTSGYRQHCMYTLLHELRHTGPQTPALAMLVEPLLPRAWRKELVPVSKRDCVEHAVADAIGQGLDRLLECFQVFEEKYANSKYHQAWLCAFKQAISGDGSAEQDPEGHLLHQP